MGRKKQQVEVNQPADVWDETLTLDGYDWTRINRLLSEYYLAFDSNNFDRWREVTTEDINRDPSGYVSAPMIMDWKILDARQVDDTHIQLKVRVVRRFHLIELWENDEEIFLV